MKFLKRILGICETPIPGDPQAWSLKGGAVRIDLSRIPELKRPGNGVRLEGNGLDTRLLVFYGDDGRYHAMANRCTHMGRRIDVIAGSHMVECCSVSKSTYTYEGQPVSGAAKKPVTPYPVSQEGDILMVDLSR